MTKIKKISSLFAVILTLALTLVPALSLSAAAVEIEHTEHVDTNDDGYCNIGDCTEAVVIPCAHSDLNGDGVCDYTTCLACISHVDSDANGVCDNEGCEAAVEPSNTVGTDKWLSNLLEALKMMGLGMLGIFIVTGIIILVIYALNKVTNREAPKDNGEE